MKNIVIDKLQLTNFKGIKKLNIDFSHRTVISGENATGKTTLFDAFFWLLFDKNSENKTQFEIKTLDKNNDPIHNLDHNVTGFFTINGLPLKLSKTYKEKWTRRRGQQHQELTGHETSYEINDVEVSAGEYKNKIATLVDERVFMLITNPLQFSQAQGWKERREVLMKILGEVNDTDVINSNPYLLSSLTSKFATRTFDELQRITKATKTKLNDELKFIPERIKEVQFSKIDPIPVKELTIEKSEIENMISELETNLKLGTAKDEQKAILKRQIYDLEDELKSIEREVLSGTEINLNQYEQLLRDELRRHSDYESTLYDVTYKKSAITKKHEQLKKDIVQTVKKLKLVEEMEFTPSTDNHECPMCKRPFDEHHISKANDELEKNFNKNKSSDLVELKTIGSKQKEEWKEAEAQINDLCEKEEELKSKIETSKEDIESLKGKISEIKSATPDPKQDVRYQSKQKEIEDIKTQMVSLDEELADLGINEELSSLKSRLSEINSELAKSGINDKANMRIQELESELQQKTEAFNDAEKLEYKLEEFLKAKVKLLESRINDRFSKVQFKLFNTQVNGGISETCEALINGVPFADANKAAKLNAGLDIINTLNDYYDTLAPIWIDNRESVNEVIETKAQLINLVVSKDKKLKVNEEN